MYYGAPPIVTDGLILNLDAANTLSYVSGSTTWRDLSGRGNNGTLINGPTFNSANGGSIVFDGVNDLVNIGNSPSLNISTGITLLCWVNITLYNSGVFMDIISKGTSFGGSDASYYISIINDGRLSFEVVLEGRIRTATVIGSNITQNWNGKWINIVGTYNNNGIRRLYIDGQVMSSPPQGSPGNIDITTGLVSLSQRRLSGNIAQVSIYNRALTPQEVLQNYNATKSRFNLT